MKKYPRKTLYWNPEDDNLIAEIAEKFKLQMQMNGIQPYQTDPETGEEVPNASKVIHFVLLAITGRIDTVDVKQARGGVMWD